MLGNDCTLPDRSRVFVPTNRAQRCGQLSEQVSKATPAMGMRDVPKHWAGATLVIDVLPYTVYNRSIR